MPVTTLKSASAVAALAMLALSACAHSQTSNPTAALPVFMAEQTHPAVTQAMGPVKTDVCLRPDNAASVMGDAVDALSSRAKAEGATALIDYQYQVRTNSPHATQCPRHIEAEAVAVILDPSRNQAATATGRQGPG